MASTRNNAQSVNQALQIFAQYLGNKKNEREYQDLYSRTAPLVTDPAAPRTNYAEQNPASIIPPEMIDVITRMAQQNPNIVNNPVFGRNLQTAAQLEALKSKGKPDLKFGSPGSRPFSFNPKTGKWEAAGPDVPQRQQAQPMRFTIVKDDKNTWMLDRISGERIRIGSGGEAGDRQKDVQSLLRFKNTLENESSRLLAEAQRWREAGQEEIAMEVERSLDANNYPLNIVDMQLRALGVEPMQGPVSNPAGSQQPKPAPKPTKKSGGL